MPPWRRVSLVGDDGSLRAPGRVAEELRSAGDDAAVLLTGHLFGRVAPHARLLCHHLGALGRPWAAESEVTVGGDRALLRLARRSGCRALLIGPEPDPLGRGGRGPAPRAAAADLRAIRRAGLLTVVRCTLGRDDDDAGVFGRAVTLCVAGDVTLPQLTGEPRPRAMSAEEIARGIAWARRALSTHAAIWRRSRLLARGGLAALVAAYRDRREVRAAPRPVATPAMRLARALARPIPIRERVPFVSTLVGAVQAGGGQVRSAWLRARAMRDETVAGLVIRLEGAIDARAARKLVQRVVRAIGRTAEPIVVDLGGLEEVSVTVLTRFLEEHATRLVDLRGRLVFRNLRPALAALRSNLHGIVPNAALLELVPEES